MNRCIKRFPMVVFWRYVAAETGYYFLSNLVEKF